MHALHIPGGAHIKYTRDNTFCIVYGVVTSAHNLRKSLEGAKNKKTADRERERERERVMGEMSTIEL